MQKIREIAIKIDTKNAYKKCNFHNEAVTLHFFRCKVIEQHRYISLFILTHYVIIVVCCDLYQKGIFQLFKKFF